MRILMVGDAVAGNGCLYLQQKLPDLRRKLGIDMTVINGENSADGNGITEKSADQLFSAGADVITTGNHAFRQKNSLPLFDENDRLLRPANFHRSAPGKGVCIVDFGRVRVAVVNLIGRVYMEPNDSPFDCIDRLLPDIDTPNILVDFHAEATSEKKVMGYYLDGRVSAVIGTHTHVQTADATVLRGGTAYLTDVGMTGAVYSVLGADVGCATKKVVTNLPVRLNTAGGEMQLNAAVIDLDEKTGKALAVETIVL